MCSNGFKARPKVVRDEPSFINLLIDPKNEQFFQIRRGWNFFMAKVSFYSWITPESYFFKQPINFFYFLTSAN